MIDWIVIFNLHIRGQAIALVPLVGAFSVCLVLLGVAVTAFCRTAQQAGSFSTAGMVLFGAIGGALVPISVLPHWARTIAPGTPTYWVMRGFRSVILDGRGLDAVMLPIVVLLSMSALFAVVASDGPATGSDGRRVDVVLIRQTGGPSLGPGVPS